MNLPKPFLTADAPRATINLNDRVAVTLTRVGREMLIKYWSQSHPANPETAADTCNPGWRSGRVVFQLWELMHIFGGGIYMGMDSPFETMTLELW